MFLQDKLREQLPTPLKEIAIIVMPHRSPEPAEVTFAAHGRWVELKIDPDAGLTERQLVHLSASL